jgi:hypothetical protein
MTFNQDKFLPDSTLLSRTAEGGDGRRWRRRGEGRTHPSLLQTLNGHFITKYHKEKCFQSIVMTIHTPPRAASY